MSTIMNLYTAEVVSKNQLTHKIYELNVKLVQPLALPFKAGQCVGFHLRNSDLTGKDKRLYSVASVPSHPAELSFCIDVSPMGAGSQFTLALKPGDRFVMEGPYGGFVVNDQSKDLLFVATGAGVAPFRAMIKDLLLSGFDKKITLLFGVRDEGDKFYFDEFENLADEYANFIFIPTLSQPKGEWQGNVGRVTKFLAEHLRDYIGRQAFICGAPPMIKDVRTLLMSKGWGIRDVKIEIFT